MLRSVVAVGVGLTLSVGTLLAQQARPGEVGTRPVQAPAYVRGTIVKVDPATNKVWIRTGTGATAQERAYAVAKTAKYYGLDNKALTDGLRAREFGKAGTTIYYRLGTGSTGITEFRFGTPPAAPGTPSPGARPGAGAGGGGR
jgi:hypothetical protein